MTALQNAFQEARDQSNIDLILPVLKEAVLYVVVASQTDPRQTPEYFLTQSPTSGRLCVTVSESEAALFKIPSPKRKILGAQLLNELPAQIEIVVVYADGGDYISQEQLAWYRQTG